MNLVPNNSDGQNNELCHHYPSSFDRLYDKNSYSAYSHHHLYNHNHRKHHHHAYNYSQDNLK